MLTNEIKIHAAIVALKVDHGHLEIARFLRVARSFVHKIRKELEKENDKVTSVSKRKNIPHVPIQWEHPNLFIMLSWKLMKTEINCNKMLHVSEKTIRRSVHDDIRYKSYVIKRGQFIFEKSKENRLNRSRRLLNKLKTPAKATMDGW